MNIPQELKELKQWVCWRLVPDNAGGKDRKLPFNPETGKAAASNKPETWTSFEIASKAVDRYGYTGMGFMFQKEGGIVGVDIDHCYDAETGTFNEVATAILERTHKSHPYCERCYAEGRMTPAEEVHHKLPISRGGTHATENLMSLCRSCHNKIHIELGDRHP